MKNSSVQALVCNSSNTQEQEIQESGDHLQKHSKCKPSWWETDPLKEINKMTFLLFMSEVKTFKTNHYVNIIPGNDIQLGSF